MMKLAIGGTRVGSGLENQVEEVTLSVSGQMLRVVALVGGGIQ